MAALDASGRRRLHCELCGTEWLYARIGCPFCGSEDQDRLGYLEAEGEEGFRVNLCEACRRYLKTVDRRVLVTPAPLDLEHLATLHLDLIAAERGYRGPGDVFA
jgi:FdhE protein